MDLSRAAYLLAAVLVVLGITGRWRVIPFAAVVAAALVFGLLNAMSLEWIGKAFGAGFGQTAAALGLTVLAGAVVAEIAEASGGAARIAAFGARRPGALLTLAAGVVAGIGATAAATFALLTPLARALGGPRRGPVALGLGLSAGHALLLPSPIVIAAVTIIGADWRLALAYGLPAAIASALAAHAWSRVGSAGADDEVVPVAETGGGGRRGAAGRRGATALVVTSIVLVAMLTMRSLADIASEPFGGGPAREKILAFGLPLLLLLGGGGLAFLMTWRWERGVLGDGGLLARAIARAAPLVLLVGATGGLSKVLQVTGMPEMNAELALDWRAGWILVPFLAAATVKTLQGSSLVAAIAGAGMVAPMLATLGLDDPSGRALAALAVGAGALTFAHVNDPLFWLVADAAGMRAPTAFLRFALGTLVQGLAGLAVLALIAAAFA